MADRRVPLPAVDFPDMRLGRHVNHDPQSLRYLVAPPTARATPKSVKHARRVPVFNQGNLGSCTVNTLLGALGTAPYYDTLPADLKRQLASPNVQTEMVQPIYREVTRRDPFTGAWEPDDTGSDGLTNAKVAKDRGWISGYQHATSLAACHEAIQRGPIMVGTMWFNGMFYPDSRGVVTLTGAGVGGHQYVGDEYDLTNDLWWFTNSWSESWGQRGRFAMSSATFQNLLNQQGDVTSMVPVTAPAPTPTPEPDRPVSPVPDAPTDPLKDFPYGALDTWAARSSLSWPRYQRNAAEAYKNWKASR